MAWLVRSRREDILSVSHTPQNVGPGAYNPERSSIRAGHPSFAPFASSTERGILSQTATDVPGPGKYYHPPSLGDRVTSAASTAFVSRVSRFDQTGKTAVPGPGSYFEFDEWGKKNRPLSLQKIRANRDQHPSTSLEWVRVASIPSIPAASQSFGFVETNTGELAPLRQADPDPLVTAAPVPSSFVPRPTLSHQRSAITVDFGKGQARRATWTSPGLDSASVAASTSTTGGGNGGVGVPGPGQYDITRSEQRVTYITRKPMSVFASGVRRLPSAPTSSAPAPNTYIPPSSFNKATERKAERLQCFGSRTDRNMNTFGSTTSTAPGPGAYDTSAKAAFKGGLDSNLGGLIPPTATTASDPLQSSSFRSCVGRFTGPAPSFTPGPGTYIAPSNAAAELASRLKGRNRSFGVTAPRFTQQNTDAEIPGPGKYDPAVGGVGVVGGGSDSSRPGVPFVSKTVRLLPHQGSASGARSGAGDADARIPPGVAAVRARRATEMEGPAPGSYNIDIEGAERAKLVEMGSQRGPAGGVQQQHFLTKEQRFDNPSTIKELLLASHLGPGRYSTTTSSIESKGGAGSSFKSQQRRFTPPSTSRSLATSDAGASLVEALAAFSEAKSTPGPGAYDVRGGIGQRGYNISIDGQRKPRPAPVG